MDKYGILITWRITEKSHWGTCHNPHNSDNKVYIQTEIIDIPYELVLSSIKDDNTISFGEILPEWAHFYGEEIKYCRRIGTLVEAEVIVKNPCLREELMKL